MIGSDVEENSGEGRRRVTRMMCWVSKRKKCDQQAYSSGAGSVVEGEGDRSVGTDPEAGLTPLSTILPTVLRPYRPGSQGPPWCTTRLGYQNATLPRWQPSPTKAWGDEPAHAPSATKKGMFAAQFEVEEQAWLLGLGQRIEQRRAENESPLHNAWVMFVADTHLTVDKSHLKCWKHKRSFAQRLFVCHSSPHFDNKVNNGRSKIITLWKAHKVQQKTGKVE